MRKIDHLGWAAAVSIRAFGVRVGIRLTRADPGLLQRLPGSFPPGARLIAPGPVDLLYSLVVGGIGQRPGVKLYHVLYSGSARVARTHDAGDLLRTLESDLSLLVGAA